MIKTKEVLHQALQALEYYRKNEDHEPTPASLTIGWLRQALAEWTPSDTAYRPDGLSQDSDQLPDTTKMIDKDFALNVALEALYNFADDESVDGWKAIDAIGVVREGFPELPPVKSYCGGKPNYCEPEHVADVSTSEERVPNPDKQRHEWQWLTEEDIHDLFMSNETVNDYGEFETIVCAASTKLKGKNNG